MQSFGNKKGTQPNPQCQPSQEIAGHLREKTAARRVKFRDQVGSDWKRHVSSISLSEVGSMNDHESWMYVRFTNIYHYKLQSTKCSNMKVKNCTIHGSYGFDNSYHQNKINISNSAWFSCLALCSNLFCQFQKLQEQNASIHNFLSPVAAFSRSQLLACHQMWCCTKSHVSQNNGERLQQLSQT